MCRIESGHDSVSIPYRVLKGAAPALARHFDRDVVRYFGTQEGKYRIPQGVWDFFNSVGSEEDCVCRHSNQTHDQAETSH